MIDKKIGTKEKILKRVLPLFLVNNYESITIGLMENATRLTRGTIYRYFENKEDIFTQAVSRYYDSPLNVLYALDPGNQTLEDYWKLKISQLESSYEYLKEYGILVDMLAISHYIEMQGTNITSSFVELIKSHKQKNMQYWTQVLKNTPTLSLNTKKISYNRAGEIYHGLFLQLCSTYPKGTSLLPEIIFPVE